MIAVSLEMSDEPQIWSKLSIFATVIITPYHNDDYDN